MAQAFAIAPAAPVRESDAALAPAASDATALTGTGTGTEEGALGNKWWVLVASVFGVFVVALDTTIVTIALPKLQAVFGADVHQIQWVVTAYSLAQAVSIPLTGWAADRFGIKRVYMLALVVFTLGSLLCGVAWNTGSMVAFRALQGLGGGPLQPLSLALIFLAFPPKERGLATGIFGIPILFAPALGPTLGGYIVQHLTWPVIFYLNAPVGILGLVLCWRVLRERIARPGARLDLPGFLLVASGLVLVLYALANGAYDGWGSLHIRGTAALGLLLLVLFVRVELRARAPLLDLRLFRNGGFTAGALVLWLTFMGLYAAAFLLPEYFVGLRGLQPFNTGLLLLWQAVATLVVAPLAGGLLINRTGPRPLLVVGMILLAVTSWQIAWLCTTASAYDSFVGPLVLRGIALGLLIVPANIAVIGSVSREQTTGATALSNVGTQVAIAVFVAVLVTVLQNSPTQHAAHLSEEVTPGNPAVVAMVDRLTTQGLPRAAAQQQVVGMLYGQIQQEAASMAFRDALIGALFAAVPGIALAFLVRRPQDDAEAGGLAL